MFNNCLVISLGTRSFGTEDHQPKCGGMAGAVNMVCIGKRSPSTCQNILPRRCNGNNMNGVFLSEPPINIQMLAFVVFKGYSVFIFLNESTQLI